MPGRVRCWWPRCSRATCRPRRRRTAAREAGAGRGSARAGEQAQPELRGERGGMERRALRARGHASGSSSSISRRLRAAERQRRVAIAHVAARLRALYESGDDDQNTTLGIVLGSSSVSDMLDRLDAARAVAAADKKLTDQATAARNRYAQAAAPRRKRSCGAERRVPAARPRAPAHRLRCSTSASACSPRVQSEVETLASARRRRPRRCGRPRSAPRHAPGSPPRRAR